MSSRPPPVPPANRSDKGPGEPALTTDQHAAAEPGRPEKPDQQGHQGNTKVNTTHQGYQQDR